MAMSGTMIVPNSDVSLSFNLSTYRGQQGFSAAIVGRVSDRLYVSSGIAGSTVRGTTGARVGFAIGF
ncbi:MAG: YadA-like family protein [Pseudomonadota bacterium]